MKVCPCGSEKNYVACCGRFIENKELPATPEELMRSRYTAYTLVNIPYIEETMTSPAIDDFPADEAREWAKRAKWLKLEIIDTTVAGDEGTVEFIAHYSEKNKKQRLHEISSFRREHNKWLYVDGQDPDAVKTIRKAEHIGRNDPCSCGSGKKYKKCCG